MTGATLTVAALIVLSAFLVAGWFWYLVEYTKPENWGTRR